MLNEHALLQTRAPDEQLFERAGKLVHDQPRPAFHPCQTPVSAQLFTWQTLRDHVSNLSSDKRKKKEVPLSCLDKKRVNLSLNP